VSDIAVDELAARLEELSILDVRTSGEYDGSLGAPCDPRQGHIPGARHLDLQEMMVLGRDELRATLGLPDAAEVVVYCHSGSRSRMAAGILSELGLQARNYPGSWHEWSRTALPLATEG
jgi:thiosulfate/3-mercaptopyruvate sulfurtransferase